MKKFIGAALVAAMLFLSAQDSRATSTLELNAITAPATGDWSDGFNRKINRVRVWSPSGASTSTVKVQVRASTSDPAYTVKTFTDVGTPGQYYNVPRCYQFRVDVTALSVSDISVVYESYTD